MAKRSGGSFPKPVVGKPVVPMVALPAGRLSGLGPQRGVQHPPKPYPHGYEKAVHVSFGKLRLSGSTKAHRLGSK